MNLVEKEGYNAFTPNVMATEICRYNTRWNRSEWFRGWRKAAEEFKSRERKKYPRKWTSSLHFGGTPAVEQLQRRLEKVMVHLDMEVE